MLFKRFIDDGFGITKANKNEFELWVDEFNLLRESITIDKFKYGNQVDFMDLFVFKGESFLDNENLTFLYFKKKRISTCTYRLPVGTKNIPLIILFLENYGGMFVSTQSRKIS